MALGPPVVRHRSFSGWHTRIARRCPGRMSEQPGLLQVEFRRTAGCERVRKAAASTARSVRRERSE